MGEIRQHLEDARKRCNTVVTSQMNKKATIELNHMDELKKPAVKRKNDSSSDDPPRKKRHRFCYIIDEKKLEMIPKNQIIACGKDIREYILSLSELNKTCKEYKIVQEILKHVTFLSQAGKFPPEEDGEKAAAIIAGSYPAYLAGKVKSYNDIDIFIAITPQEYLHGHRNIMWIVRDYLNRRRLYKGVNGIYAVANFGRLQFILKEFKVSCNGNTCDCEYAFNKYFFKEFEHCTRYRLFFYLYESTRFKAITKYIPKDEDRQILAERTCILPRKDIDSDDDDDDDDDDDPIIYDGYWLTEYGENKPEFAKYTNIQICRLLNCGGKDFTPSSIYVQAILKYAKGEFKDWSLDLSSDERAELLDSISDNNDWTTKYDKNNLYKMLNYRAPRYPEKHLNNVIDFAPPSLYQQALLKYVKCEFKDWSLDLSSDERVELMNSDERIRLWVLGRPYAHIRQIK